MLRVFIVCAVFALSQGISAQAVDASICNILSHPSAFDGKIVRIRGTVVAGFDEFVIKDDSCKGKIDGIWLAYPDGSKAKAGPAAMLRLQLASNSPAKVEDPKRTPIKLDRDKEFKHFDSVVSADAKTKEHCLGCPKYLVKATLTGRLDGVDRPVLDRKDGKFVALQGFGNMNRYPARLVIQSVSDVEKSEIDYSKPAAGTAPGISLGLRADQVVRAAAAYGPQGEYNPVLLKFGTPNSEETDREGKGETPSPDGLLLFVTLDGDRLRDGPEGTAMAEAMAHMGTHIADLRESPNERDLFELEAHAWAAAILAAVQGKAKTLMLPGGYVLWDGAWTDAERDRLLPVAASSYLTDWSGLRP